jgi:hypothetical protein
MVEKKIANSHCYIEMYLFMKKKRESGQLTDKIPQEQILFNEWATHGI